MRADAARKGQKDAPVRYGSPRPRVGPPRPVRTAVQSFLDECACLEIKPFPWQITTGQYLYALGPQGRWLFPEVADVVSRQNGKTELLVPHIVTRLRAGRKIMHTAQNRVLPREVYDRVATHMIAAHADELAKMPRHANGQEFIRLLNGGLYRIVAPTRGGARGPSNDDLLIDEVREFTDHSFPAAAGPTLNASRNPQTFYLSNAGDEESVVLNAIRARGGVDPSLAYLEWSAAPEREPDDIRGWLEANPSAGHLPQIVDNLAREYRRHQLANTLSIFETEHLCRWVASMQPPVVTDAAWTKCHAEITAPRRPSVAISVDSTGTRVSAVSAWQQPDGTVALDLVADVRGDPISFERLGPELQKKTAAVGAFVVGYDPWTDSDLARYFTKARIINGRDYTSASVSFALAVESGRIRWQDATEIGEDLKWMTREDRQGGSWMAVKTRDGRPVTAGLAAIRASWMASNPAFTGEARIY